MYVGISFPDGNPNTQVIDFDYEQQVLADKYGTGTVTQVDSTTINVNSPGHGLADLDKINISNENSWYGVTATATTVTVVDVDNFTVELFYNANADSQVIKWVKGTSTTNLTVNRESDVKGNDLLNASVNEYSANRISVTPNRFWNYMYRPQKIVAGYTYYIEDATGLMQAMYYQALHKDRL